MRRWSYRTAPTHNRACFLTGGPGSAAERRGGSGVVVPSLVLDAQQGDGGRGRGGRAPQPGGSEARGALIRRPAPIASPQFPPPSILDYKPHSTLVVPAAPGAAREVSRSSTSTATSRRRSRRSSSTTLAASMDPLNLQVLVNSSRRVGRSAGAKRWPPSAPASTRTGWCSSRPSTSATSARASARRAAQQLEADVKAGALGVGEIEQGLRPDRQEGRRHAAEARRSRARSDLADGGAAEHPGLHPHRRSAGVLRADRTSRTSAGSSWRCIRIAGVRRRPIPSFERSDGGARPAVQAAPEDDVHRRAPGLARQRPGAAGQDVRRDAERLRGGRRRALRPRPAAADRARLLRQVPGPAAVRQGQLPARRIPVLLARASRPPTSISTTTGTITRSGSCTASACPIRCCASCITRTR